MNFKTMARIAGAIALTGALAGCMDVDAEIEVLSETTGKATSSMTMGAEFYPMIKQMAEADPDGASTDGFCVEEGEVLTENGDGSATCVSTAEGDFATLTGSEGPTEDTTFTVVSPGVVRVAMKTESMSSQVTEGQDEEAMQMLKAYLEGHNVALRIKGKKVIETNMTLSEDGRSAEIVIPFLGLIEGNLDLPEELFAVVDTR